MTFPVSAMRSGINLPQLAPVAGAKPTESFGAVMRDAIDKVEAFQKHAGKQHESLLNGESEDLHNVALAAQRAGLAFDLFLHVRNKVVEAYQEVMRMQV